LLGAVVHQYEADGTFLWKTDLQKIVVAWKGEPDTAWMAELPAHAALDVCARLDKALKRMLSERKAGRQCGFPRFKKKRWGEGSVYFVNQATRLAPDGRTAKLPKLGTVRMRGGVVPIGRLLGSRAVREGDRWLLAAQVECVKPAPMPSTGARIGIDAGLRNLAVSFDGTDFDRIEAPKPLRKALKRLRRAQRCLARRKKGSARRRAQVKRVAALHRKVRCRRLDFLHKVSHRLTAKADAIVIETLDVRAMARDRRLGLSVADAAIGTLHQFIAHKADWRGRKLIKAPADFPSTRMCCRCSTLNDMPLGKRLMSCGCGNKMDRDDNAAVNLFKYPEEPGNGAREGAKRGESWTSAGCLGVPASRLGEPRMLGTWSDHESK